MGAAAKTQKRRDPAPRPIVDAGGTFSNLRNKDPKKHYVMVNRAGRHNVEFFKHLGYETVKYHPEGPQFISGAQTVQEGEEIRFREGTLMCIDKDRKERIDQHGWDGRRGVQHRQRQEERLLTKKARQMDPFEGRARNSAYFDFENETGPEQPVI